MNGLVKSYLKNLSIGGGWDEDLDSSPNMYGTFHNMCDVLKNKKLRTLTVMLSEDDFYYLSPQIYEYSIKTLHSWYSSDENRFRTLTV